MPASHAPVARSATLWAVLSLLPAGPAAAQDATRAGAPSMAHAHIGYVAHAFAETPTGQGLLATAVAEAELAIQHAGLAASDPANLEAARRHLEDVLHAVDPALAPFGPGLGYGVRRAALGIAEQIELAAGVEGASDNVRTHSAHIAGAARSVVARVDRIAALAAQIRATTSASAGAQALTELGIQTQALFAGLDEDGDERVGWAAPEGGLRQIQLHMTLLERGEGMTPHLNQE